MQGHGMAFNARQVWEARQPQLPGPSPTPHLTGSTFHTPAGSLASSTAASSRVPPAPFASTASSGPGDGWGVARQVDR